MSARPEERTACCGGSCGTVTTVTEATTPASASSAPSGWLHALAEHWRATGAGAAIVIGALAGWTGAPAWAGSAAYLLAVALLAGPTLRRARRSVKARRLDIHVLMLIAVAGALALGELLEAATVLFLFDVAQVLEARSLSRARRAIGALIDLTPATVTIHTPDGSLATVPPEAVKVGDRMLVRPGERIAVDAEVLTGTSEVDEAPVTGEPLPVVKEPGDALYSGSVNGSGALDARVTRRYRDSTLARIIHLVEHAQAQRSPAQAFIDRFAAVYTPVMLGIAVLIAVVPPLVFAAPFDTWAYRALVLLVIACPCALVISTPVSVVSALAAAARRGVLIKGGLHLERSARIRCLAFDKTGTLTHGEPEVCTLVPLDGLSANDVLAVAASLESASEHPIGRAIVERAEAERVRRVRVTEFRALPGRGAEGRIDGREAVVGNHRLFEERRLCSERLHAELERIESQGATAIMLAVDGRAVGLIGVSDRARESGRDAVSLLRVHGVEHVVLLTGDNETSARRVAETAGVDSWRAGLLPEDKVAAIRELRGRYGPVAMIGDGVNDAPALAAADVGIAMGAGTGAALETADVALMADELLKVPFTLRLGRATLRNIQANVAFSIGLKAAVLALAVAGFASLWLAVLADTGASLIVVANALRLLRVQ